MAKDRKDRKPPRTVLQSTRFGKAKKRLHTAELKELDVQVKAIVDDPLVGEAKAGALKDVRVVKFKVHKTQYLLAYQFNEKRNVIELLDLGTHENYYRDLQSYLDDR